MKTSWDSVLRGGVLGRGPVAESSAEPAGLIPPPPMGHHHADPRSLAWAETPAVFHDRWQTLQTAALPYHYQAIFCRRDEPDRCH